MKIFVILQPKKLNAMISRTLENAIFNEMVGGKAILIFGARRVGKTILLEQLMQRYQGKINLLNGEDYSTEMLLKERTIANYQQLLQGTDLLVIDEAQNIPEIGKILKLITDHLKNLSILVSGSSAFDFKNQTGEPLVGRSYSFQLYPLSFSELATVETRIELMQRLEERLLFGNYPELIAIDDFAKKQRYLTEIANAYLLKDILSIDGIKNSSKMLSLLRLIAYQMGNEVSYEELGEQLALSRNTIEKYLDLLSKTFVIYKLSAFSRNQRKEVSKLGKWYFFDNGIRNAVLGNFSPIASRQDAGALWESFLIGERIKRNNNLQLNHRFYFWRSYSGQEIDLIEEENDEIQSFEFKWGEHRHPKIPSSFKESYPNVPFTIIDPSNFLDYILY